MKIETTAQSAKDLKEIAKANGIEFPPLAKADEMKKLLSENNLPIENKIDGTPVGSTSEDKTLSEVTSNTAQSEEKETVVIDRKDLDSILSEIAWLKQMINSTTDTNKIRDYEKSLKKLDNFSFSIKIFEDMEWQYPIIKWRTINNYVANEWKDVDQRIEITFIKNWKEENKEIKLVDFARILKKSEPIPANKITEIDWREVYIDEVIHPTTKMKYFLFKQRGATYNVSLTFEWQNITILSTYLNA